MGVPEQRPGRASLRRGHRGRPANSSIPSCADKVFDAYIPWIHGTGNRFFFCKMSFLSPIPFLLFLKIFISPLR